MRSLNPSTLISALTPVGFDADGLHHRHAEFRGQPLGIDDDALAARDVGHVERHHHGQAQALQAQHQSQVLAQVGRIGHANHEIRLALAGAAAEQHVGRDLFIRRQRIEAVGAGQIQNANPRGPEGVSSEPSLRSTVTPA